MCKRQVGWGVEAWFEATRYVFKEYTTGELEKSHTVDLEEGWRKLHIRWFITQAPVRFRKGLQEKHRTKRGKK